MSLFSELKRRGVFPIAAAYAVTAWLLIQIADVLLSAFAAPEWILRAGIIILALGFPVSLIMAWLFEWTPQGVKRSEELPADYSGTSAISKTLNIVIISVLSAALLLFVWERFSGQNSPSGSFFQSGPDGKTVAALPFANRSNREEDLFFSEGIHDDLLTRLAKIVSLRVTSRTSVMRYRDTEKSLPEIGSELGVAAIIEGGVQRSGEQVRINVQLIDASNDVHLWAETYDRQLTAENLFAIQSEIARAIASALQATLTPAEEQFIDRIPTRNMAAYDAYLQGRQYMSQHNIEGFRQALDSFVLAAELDPDFSSAYAGQCELQLVWYKFSGETSRFESARSACEKALSIDPEAADTRIALAALLRHDGDYTRAVEEVRRALAIEPDNVNGLVELGMILQLQARAQEAETVLLRAIELDPGHWQAFDVLSQLYLLDGGSPDSEQLALKYALRVTEMRPDSASAYNNLGTVYDGMQQYEDARNAWDRALQLEPTRTGYTNRGLSYYYDGHFEDAVEMQRKAIDLAPSDHRAWGRLAESYRFVEGQSAAAHEAYTMAASLAEPMLEINAQDWKTRSLLAVYLAHLDRGEEAVLLIEQSLDSSHRDPENLLYAALVRYQLGDHDGAVTALEEAVEKDNSYRRYATLEPDFRGLQENQRYRQLLSDSQ